MRFSLNQSEEKKLLSLFNQHEINLDYLIYLRSVFIDKPVLFDKNKDEQSDYDIKKVLFDKLERLYPYPNAYVKDNILWDTQILKADHFYTNPYLKALKGLAFKEKGWTLKNVKRSAFSLCPYQEEYAFGSNYSLKMGVATFDKDYIYPSISLYDQEWMSLNQHEIRTMETPIAIAKGKVLTLGLGLGYFAFVASNKEEVKEVHIVEMDLELIQLFDKYLLPLFPHKEKIHIHKADAYHFIESIRDGDYNYIFSDLWQDVSDGVVFYLKLKKVFHTFKKTTCAYWIEGSILSYLRLLVIGVMKDEYYQLDKEYDDIQKFIKNKLVDYQISNSQDIDALLSNQGLDNLFFY